MQRKHQPAQQQCKHLQRGHALAAEIGSGAKRFVLQGIVQSIGQGGGAPASANSTHGRWQSNNRNGITFIYLKITNVLISRFFYQQILFWF